MRGDGGKGGRHRAVHAVVEGPKHLKEGQQGSTSSERKDHKHKRERERVQSAIHKRKKASNQIEYTQRLTCAQGGPWLSPDGLLTKVGS